MELTISDEKTKALLTEVMVELGLTNAIKDGRREEYVAEGEIFSILDGPPPENPP